MKRIWIPQLIAIIALAVGLSPHNPYAYYTLLRWICCGSFAYVAVHALHNAQMNWVWLLGFTAALYNPILPVHLTRELWQPINVATIALGIVSIFQVKRSPIEDHANRP